MANKHTIEELRQRQALPLEAKIQMTYARVKDWIDAYGEQGVYISFSGGKDSTVLLDLVRNRFGYSDVKAVFVDVPTQFPELRQFVKTFENVDVIKPKISFMEVCEKYGFPLISKEVSEAVWGARRYLEDLASKGELPTEVIGGGGDTGTNTNEFAESGNGRTGGYAQFLRKVLGAGEYSKRTEGTSEDLSEQLADLLNERMLNHSGGRNKNLATMLGWITKDKDHPIKANIPSQDKSRFSAERYKFFLEAPFEI